MPAYVAHIVYVNALPCFRSNMCWSGNFVLKKLWKSRAIPSSDPRHRISVQQIFLVLTYPLILERSLWYFCDDNSKSGSTTNKCRYVSLRDELWSYGVWGVPGSDHRGCSRSLARIMAILLLGNSPLARAAARFCTQNYWKQPGTFRTEFGPKLSFNCRKRGRLYWNIKNDLSTSNWPQKKKERSTCFSASTVVWLWESWHFITID